MLWAFPCLNTEALDIAEIYYFILKICGLKFIGEPFYQGNVGKLNKRLKKLSQFDKIFYLKTVAKLSKAELGSYMWKNRGHKLTGEAEGILGGVGRILLWVEGWGELVTLLLVFQGMSGLSVLS